MIAVLGHPHSGTTVVRELLQGAAGGEIIHEPLHPIPNRSGANVAFMGEAWKMARKYAGTGIFPKELMSVVDDLQSRDIVGYKEMFCIGAHVKNPEVKVLYLMRQPASMLASWLRRGTGALLKWYFEQLERYFPVQWQEALAPFGDRWLATLAAAHRVRLHHDLSCISGRENVKTVWFADLWANHETSWPSILNFLELEPTRAFLDRLRRPMEPNQYMVVSPYRDLNMSKELVDVVHYAWRDKPEILRY